MPLSTASIKFYAPASDDGGGINLSALQTSSVLENEFPNVTDEQRQAGLVDYRKQYVRNENTDYWDFIRVWIQSQPPAGDSIKICQTGSLSLINATASLGTATFLSGTVLNFASCKYRYVMPGDWVYDMTHDTEAATIREITDVSTNSGEVTVASAFGTPTDGDHEIVIAPATRFSYSSPSSYGDGLDVGKLENNQYSAVWKQRTVPAFTDGYSNDNFTVTFGSGPV